MKINFYLCGPVKKGGTAPPAVTDGRSRSFLHFFLAVGAKTGKDVHMPQQQEAVLPGQFLLQLLDAGIIDLDDLAAGLADDMVMVSGAATS